MEFRILGPIEVAHAGVSVALGGPRHRVLLAVLLVHQELGNHRGQAGVWDSLGYTHHQLRNHTEAIACCQQAIELFRDLGEQREEAITVTRLGDVHQAISRPDHARDAWQAALTILDQLDHPDAEQVTTKLRRLDHSPTTPSNTSDNSDVKRTD